MRRRYYTPRSIRNLERKNRKGLIIRLIIAVILIYAIFMWGLPALIGGLSVFNRLKPVADNQISQTNPALAPPVLNIPFEATNSSQIRIDGYSLPSTKVEIYLDEQLVSTTNTDQDGRFVTDLIELSLGTNNIYGLTVDTNSNKSFSSKTIRVIFNNEKPQLEVSSPSDGQQFSGSDKKITISGKTDPENFLTINGSRALIKSDGTFNHTLELSEGENKITTISTNSVGNSTNIERNVSYKP